MDSFRFHPVISRWFKETYGSPTEPQERGWPAIQTGAHTLIAAPTGSGKTLAAFFAALDQLFQEGLAGRLQDQTRVLYVSPLKALSNDIHRNLELPLAGIRAGLRAAGLQDVEVRAEVRTGDTPAARRRLMLRKPPHILVTTPESLYLLLTSLSGRKLLSTVRTLIVDEIHAVANNRRGSHLALSIERLAALVNGPLQRIGLSATQKPIELVAEFLVGAPHARPSTGLPEIIDCGWARRLDLAIEIPGSPLEAVMSNEVWIEVYQRLAQLIEAHRTTLVFVNTRRMAERVTHRLGERLGKDHVTSHHGSLSAALRVDAETRLKRGELKALVATSSLELGIDIGSVDLVCQLGTTRSIATFLQRIGRAGHQREGLPKGRLFALTRDELVECVALLQSVRRGELDALQIPEKPLDVLAQQIVACAATEDWEEERLFERLRSAWPYRNLERNEFDQVVRMLAEGFSTKRGRRGALIHHDAVNHRVRGRRGARLVALTSGGAIPENSDYRVVLEPSETFIGTVNEDFAVESLAGDIFQLGNASWRILRINTGTVRVEDAQGQPPNIPFWLGEAPGRTRELSEAVSYLRAEIEKRIQLAFSRGAGQGAPGGELAGKETLVPSRSSQEPWPLNGGSGSTPEALAFTNGTGRSPLGQFELATSSATCVPATSTDSERARDSVALWLSSLEGLPEAGVRQLADYFVAGYRSLGAIPSQDKLVIERFFDESGGMQLVIHSPFGIRINRAWGLALRKRFCRSFNFELQAAASDEAILLSLGTQHSFPLDEVYRYLKSKTVRDLLVQALLDAPMFPIRWRWNASRALALPRQRGGRKIPPPLQRMEAENLLAAVFPDQLACLENIVGDREIPDHPLVRQTIEDCLTEAMDIQGLIGVFQRIESGEILCTARDLPEPSVLAHEILNSKVYTFLDDAPLEERRAHAVYTRRASEISHGGDLGVLDAAAIEKVCAEAWPRAANPDELHEALLLAGVMTETELARVAVQARQWLELLSGHKRACTVHLKNRPEAFWTTAERLPEVRVIYPDATLEPLITAPRSTQVKLWEPSEAIRELVRGRMEIGGPETAREIAAQLLLTPPEIETALRALESEGFVLRGRFHPAAQELEWCDRRLLARIHRLTINRLRAEIEPVCISDFLRFLAQWQRVDPEHRSEGRDGVEAVLELLDGYEVPAAAWEPEILALRVKNYAPEWLDQFCFRGRIGWGRLSPPQNQNSRPSAPVRSSPISLFTRQNLGSWLALTEAPAQTDFSPDTSRVLDALLRQGASFFGELAKLRGLLPSRIEQALAELVAQGWVTSDSFEGLRALLTPPDKRVPFADQKHKRHHKAVTSIEFAGRWSLLRVPGASRAQAPTTPGREGHIHGDDALPAEPRVENQSMSHEDAVEILARTILRRYGVVFRRLLERESLKVSWFQLGRVYRQLEARGEIRGGYFVGGVSGEQFALPEAIGLLRTVRKQPTPGRLVAISGADPLNLAGILTPGPRVSAVASNRILLRDGVPIAALQAGEVLQLSDNPALFDRAAERVLSVGELPVPLRPYYA